jgi:NAD(P)-dependent dehydrogenase (short-subunit alcohol dehydrogenase family)
MFGISSLIVAKGAVAAMTKTLAVELAAKGIRVNSISAGVIKTPGAKQKAAKFLGVEALSNEQFDEFAKNMSQSIPLKRLGESTEVAKAALFLASDESSYVTGSDLVVDGGKSSAW